MDWMSLLLGLVLGSAVTSLLIWTRRSQQGAVAFQPVALSVVLTALLAGVIRQVAGPAAGVVAPDGGIMFGSGWMIGGLIAAWVLTQRPG